MGQKGQTTESYGIIKQKDSFVIVSYFIEIIRQADVRVVMCVTNGSQFGLRVLIFRSSLQMIKQSQIRNFISLIARKKLETTSQAPDSKPLLDKLQLSNRNINKCKRYETEPIQDRTQPTFLSYNDNNLLQDKSKKYIKLSLYQKYRRSLQIKKNQITLQTECLIEMQKQNTQMNKSKQKASPINRATHRSKNKVISIFKQRILSTPSHPLYYFKPERTLNIEDEQKRLPSLLPQRLIQGEKQNDSRPVFRVKKYQPLNFQISRVDKAHRVFAEEVKPHLYSKLKLQNKGRLKSSRKLGEKTRRQRTEILEVLQQSLSGWIVDKGKSRCQNEMD